MDAIDKILEKAFTDTDLASGGLMNPEQAAKFVQGIIEQSVIIKECRREPMKANKRQIDKITYSADCLQKPVAVGSEHTSTTKPTTDKVTLDAQEAIVAIDLGYDSLEDSIEGRSIEDTIMELATKKIAYELDNLCLNGNTAGATGTYLDILNGILLQVTTNSFDATGLLFDKTVAKKTLHKLPGKYYDLEEDYRFYVSHKARLDYVDSLAAIAVDAAFQQYLTGKADPAYNGTPVRKVPALTTFDTGGSVMGSNGLLINPKNIVFGIHRDITWEMMRQPRKRVIEITATMRIDFKIEQEDAAVKIAKIKHST